MNGCTDACLYVCIHVCLCLYVCISVVFCLCVCVSMSECMHICVFLQGIHNIIVINCLFASPAFPEGSTSESTTYLGGSSAVFDKKYLN
jgi:hypothetical protein